MHRVMPHRCRGSMEIPFAGRREREARDFCPSGSEPIRHFGIGAAGAAGFWPPHRGHARVSPDGDVRIRHATFLSTYFGFVGDFPLPDSSWAHGLGVARTAPMVIESIHITPSGDADCKRAPARIHQYADIHVSPHVSRRVHAREDTEAEALEFTRQPANRLPERGGWRQQLSVFSRMNG